MSIPLTGQTGPSDADLIAEINLLRKAKNAVILAHYYQDGKIQDLADFVGDSLDLSRKAASTNADVIVFCGVRFMAEVAKILSPDKTVVIPDMEAGCSLEDSCPADDFAAFRARHPDHISLTYINCSAAVKTHSDIIITSSNARHIIDQIPKDQPILLAPDQHLGGYLAKETGRDMVLWPGWPISATGSRRIFRSSSCMVRGAAHEWVAENSRAGAGGRRACYARSHGGTG